jgi:hypothetical protein
LPRFAFRARFAFRHCVPKLNLTLTASSGKNVSFRCPDMTSGVIFTFADARDLPDSLLDSDFKS